MNLENTKLDLSGYSEEEREEIAKAYTVACGKRDIGGHSFKFYFCNPVVNHLTIEDESFDYFKGHRYTEVKPIKKEEWVSINSLDELQVGSVVRLSDFKLITIVYKGVSCYAEHCNGAVVLDEYNAYLYKKLSTTYTFEPVQDDSLAIECFNAYHQNFHYSVNFNIQIDEIKQAWRVVAALKLQQK